MFSFHSSVKHFYCIMALRMTTNNIWRILTNQVHFEKINSFRTLNRICNVKCSQWAQVSTGVRQNVFENDSLKPNKSDTLYAAQNDPDSFGREVDTNELLDEGDIEEEEYIQNPPGPSQKLRVIDYARMIKDHLRNKDLKEAIDVLDVRMKNDRVKPNKYIYNLLISGCGKAGYSKKAFQLYNKMKQRGIPVIASTYTSLFNACANSPWPKDGLIKANRLREIILEKGFIPNSKNYHAMIKAYGRCGDTETAFMLADEMIDKKMDITTETFNFLLQACASDWNLGFRHALITWHKMLQQGVSPDIYSFDAILRCTRDCSIGDVEEMKEFINQLINGSNMNVKAITSGNTLLLTDSTSDSADEGSVNSDTTITAQQENLPDINPAATPILGEETPNLLSKTPYLGSLVSIAEISKPEEKFLLLGGFSGFMNEMKKAKITPGIEIFTSMLEVIPSTKASEKQIISAIRKIGLKVDIDFFNILIKKRSMRFDYDGAKEVLSMIRTAKLHPDIITYGVLALGCQTEENARELLNEMRAKGIRMNIQILGAMLKQGCVNKNFAYVHEILQITLDEQIKPNEAFLKHLHIFHKRLLSLVENKHPSTKSKTFSQNYKNFKEKLNIWNEEMGISDLKLEDAVKKLKGKPYEQFKSRQITGFEEIKNEKLKNKLKTRKYISRIKLNDLKDDN